MPKKPPPGDAAETTPRLNSLAEALRARGIEVQERVPAPPSRGQVNLSSSPKVVVRRERKGHGGKTVTVIEGLRLSSKDLDSVAQQLRKALGCGSWVEEGRILLQGDRAPAAETWLRAQGAPRVVRGT